MAYRAEAGHTPKKMASNEARIRNNFSSAPVSANCSIDESDELDDALLAEDTKYYKPTPQITLDPTAEGSEDDYFNEDDFEEFEGSVDSKTSENKAASITSLNNSLRQSPIVKPMQDDDAIEEENGKKGEEDTDLDGMTLESYMAEFMKKKPVGDFDDELVNGETVDGNMSPEAVDPQGLDGCSPGPGQRHINGTDSPFRLEIEVDSHISPRPTPSGAANVQNLLQDSPEAKQTLENILSKVNDVQTQILGLAKQSPTKPSPIQRDASSPYHTHIISTRSPSRHDIGSPSIDTKLGIVKKELKKRTDELNRANERNALMQENMIALQQQIKSLESDLMEERSRTVKANKAKAKAQKSVQKLTEELEQYTALVEGVQELRDNETKLLQKVSSYVNKHESIM